MSNSLELRPRTMIIEAFVGNSSELGLIARNIEASDTEESKVTGHISELDSV